MKLPIPVVIAGALALIIVASCSRPTAKSTDSGAATSEARAYLPNLALSNVEMQATENFMNQHVVEVTGNLSNNGPRKLALVDVYCLFSGLNGAEIHRERATVIRSALPPGETRLFRLPFDALPDGWNQAMPHLVIAQIKFTE